MKGVKLIKRGERGAIRQIDREEVEFTVGDKTFLCQEGDILWHRSDLAHGIRNPGVERATYLTLLAPPALK